MNDLTQDHITSDITSDTLTSDVATDEQDTPTQDAEATYSPLRAFAPYTAELHEHYFAVMGVFTRSSVADLGVEEIAQRADLDPHDTASLVTQLVRWGNLTHSPIPPRFRSIEEAHRARNRYQLTSLGRAAHEMAASILTLSDAFSDVASDLLPSITQTLTAIAHGTLLTPAEARTLFLQHANVVKTMNDFSTELSEIRGRIDLDDALYREKLSVLHQYIDVVVRDADRHDNVLRDLSRQVSARIDAQVAHLASTRTPASGVVEEGPALSRAAWEDLCHFYSGAGNGLPAFRDRAVSFVHQILAACNRLSNASLGRRSGRNDLIHLARLFAGLQDEETAHRLGAAAFGVFSARHLRFAAAQADGRTSWWTTIPASVPVSLQRHGNRAVRGRVAAVTDLSAARARRRQEAEARAQATVSTATTLATGTLEDLSLEALTLLARLVAAAASTAPRQRASAVDASGTVEVIVTPAPGATTRAVSPHGAMTWTDVRIVARPAKGATGDSASHPASGAMGQSA